MRHEIALQIATETFLALANYQREYGDERDPSEIASLAIEAWLAVASSADRFRQK